MRRGRALCAAALLIGFAAVGNPCAQSAPTATGPASESAVDTLRTAAAARNAAFLDLVDFSEPFTVGGVDAAVMAPNAAVARREAEASAAAAEADAARAARLPKISASANAAWIGNPAAPLSLAAGELGVIPPLGPGMPPIALPPEDYVIFEGSGATRYEVKVAVEQPLFSWWKISAGIDAATAAASASRALASGERHQRRVRIGADLETLRILREVDAVLLDQEAAGDRLVRISEESYRGGFITETQLRDARLKLKETSLARAQNAETRGRVMSELRGLIGREELAAADLDASAPLPRAARAPSEASSLIAAALAGNWDLAALARGREATAAQKRISEGSGELRPDLGLKAEFSFSGAFEDIGTAEWTEAADWQATIGVGLSGVLFDAGRSTASRTAAAAQTAATVSQVEDAQERVRSAVEASLLRLDLLRLRLEHAALTLSVREREEADAASAFAVGAGGEAELLRAIIDRFAAIANGYGLLAEYRGELWRLAGLLGAAAE